MSEAAGSANRPAVGMALMFSATIIFSLMHAAIRHVSGELHPFEMAFFRNLFGLLVMGPILLRYGLAPLRTARFPLHGLRAIFNLVAMLCFFYALSITPLADVAALSFTAPLFATILAVFVLGEVVRIRRWTAIMFGFAGAFVAIRPGFEHVGLGPLLVLTQAAVWGGALIVIKILGRTESSITIAAYMVLLMIPLSAGPALLFWQTPTLEQLAWLALIGVLGTFAQLLMTQALKETEATLVLSLDFFKLVWATMLGYWLFGEVPDEFTWVGGMMIFASATYIAYREANLRGRRE
ncbi:MAG: DMT family transporter [Alphaproteobacteria bacterium]|nr:DMT family transporter [Alphaproteobacteria bacterium]